jgi:hypothetical protein
VQSDKLNIKDMIVKMSKVVDKRIKEKYGYWRIKKRK